MKIKSRNEILKDVIKEGKKHPKDWKAIFGKDEKRFSRDYYIFNPNIGIYLLKEYQKNPYEIKGIGGKIARKVDEDIETKISKYSGDFGIIQGDFTKVLKNIENSYELSKFNSLNFEALLDNKKGLYSIRVDIQYRLEFKLLKNSVILEEIVLIEELSKHYR